MARTLQTSDIAKQRDVALLQGAAQSLLATASNVLDVSTIDAKSLRIQDEPFDLKRY